MIMGKLLLELILIQLIKNILLKILFINKQGFIKVKLIGFFLLILLNMEIRVYLIKMKITNV